MKKQSIKIISIIFCTLLLYGCYKPLVKVSEIQNTNEPKATPINIEIDDEPIIVNFDIQDPSTPISNNISITIENIKLSIPKKYPIIEGKKYCGTYVDNPYDISKFNGSTNIMAWFDNFDEISENKISACLDEHKATAFITLQPEGWYLSNIAAGKHDDKIIAYFQNLSKGDRVNTELFVRFAHEFEMRPGYTSWYIWQTDEYKNFIKAWRRVVRLGHMYAPNVKWVWSPNRADKYTVKYYPGDEYVDYVSLSLNDRFDRESFEYFYENEGKRSYLEEYNKPIIFGEVAEYHRGYEKRNKYVTELFEYLKNYDNCIGVVFLDKDTYGDRFYKFSNSDILLKNFNTNARKYIYEEVYNKISDIDKMFNYIGYFRVYSPWFLFRSILLNF